MATTTYLEDLTLAGRDALYTFLSDALDTKGWTRTVINASAADPTANELAVREEVFQSPGDAVDIGGFFVAMRVFRDGSGLRNSIMIYAFTAIGAGGFVAITSIARSAGTVITVTTTAPHQMTTGDLVVVNGTDNILLNECNSGLLATHNTITVTGASTFTYTSNNSGVQAGTGGTCFAVFNLSGALTAGVNDAFRINVDDVANDFVGGVDEFAISGDVIQAGNFRYFHLGAVGRGHIPATMSQTLTSSGTITGTGALQTIATNETPNDLFVGQPIDIIDSESGLVKRTKLGVIGPGDAVQAIVQIGDDFAANAVIGWDPMPVFVAGQSGTGLTTQSLNTINWQCCYAINGDRTWANTDPDDSDGLYGIVEPRVDTNEKGIQDTADTKLGAVASYDIIVIRTDSTPIEQQGARGPVRNSVGVVLANMNDFDFGQAGKTLPDDIYKAFTTQQISAADDHIAYGPNVPGAPPLP